MSNKYQGPGNDPWVQFWLQMQFLARGFLRLVIDHCCPVLSAFNNWTRWDKLIAMANPRTQRRCGSWNHARTVFKSWSAVKISNWQPLDLQRWRVSKPKYPIDFGCLNHRQPTMLQNSCSLITKVCWRLRLKNHGVWPKHHHKFCTMHRMQAHSETESYQSPSCRVLGFLWHVFTVINAMSEDTYVMNCHQKCLNVNMPYAYAIYNYTPIYFGFRSCPCVGIAFDLHPVGSYGCARGCFQGKHKESSPLRNIQCKAALFVTLPVPCHQGICGVFETTARNTALHFETMATVFTSQGFNIEERQLKFIVAEKAIART